MSERPTLSRRIPLVRGGEHAARAESAVLALHDVRSVAVETLPLPAINLDVPWNPRGKVTVNPYTPERLSSLVESVRRHGVLQPLLVRPHPETPGAYQLVAGFRRYHSAEYSGLREVPVRVLHIDDDVASVVAIIENTERENLDDIDETFSVFERLSAATGLSVVDVARTLKSVLNGAEDERGLSALLAELSPLGLSSWANRRAKVLSMTDAEIGAVRARLVPVTVAEQLVRLGERPERAAFLERAQSEGWKVEDAQREVGAVTGSRRRADETQVLVKQTMQVLKPAALKRVSPERREQALALLRQVNELLSE